MIALLRRISALALCLVFTRVASGDVVVMNNGDRLTGSVKTAGDGRLILATTYAGEIDIALADVRQISTDSPVRLVLEDETQVSGILSATDGSGMTIGGVLDPEPGPVTVARIAAINPPEAPRLVISGQLNGGLERDRGNTDEDTYHVDAETVFRWIDSRLSFSVDGDLEKTNNDKTKQKADGFVKYDYFFNDDHYMLNDKWYLWSGAGFEHDKFADLTLRSVVGLGPGYQVIETERTNFLIEAGPSYTWENFESSENDSYGSARWSLNFKHQLFEAWKLAAFHDHSLLWNLEDTNDYVLKTKTGLRVPIFDNMHATLQFNFDRDNAPAASAKKNDYETLITGGYSW